MSFSCLQQARLQYKPRVKIALDRKKLKIGVLFSGGPAAGGHNVIAALFDSGATLTGFLNGPSGLIENKQIAIRNVDAYRNQGGFDLLGSGRTKIETDEQMKQAVKSMEGLDGLVVIGGDDSNTNAAFLAKQCKIPVVGVPKTIDNDLQSEKIAVSFGFDSAVKTYAELIGNLGKDAVSSRKYYHFVRLMGRAASHIALECAFLTQPNLTLIIEEKKSSEAIVKEIVELIEKRFAMEKEYGIILIPEGLADQMPDLLQGLAKDPHGNAPLSQVEVEKWLIELVKKELDKRHFKGKFSPLSHFFGYEGRCCMPSNFDANYCYALGLSAYSAILKGHTGVICSVQNLEKGPETWTISAEPIEGLMHEEIRLGKKKKVVKKTLVNIDSQAFKEFKKRQEGWMLQDAYLTPGPMQFFGSAEVCDQGPYTLRWK